MPDADNAPSPSTAAPSRLRTVTRVVVGAALVAVTWTGLVGHWLPDWLRPRVETAATEALGTPVRLGGLAIAPWRLEVTASDLTVGPTDKPWLKLKQAEVGVSLESLWRFAPVIKRVDLLAPELDVERLSADRFNFSPLLDKLQQPSPEPKADTGPARFAILNIRLRDGVVRYADRVLDQSHLVDRIRLEVPFVSSLPSDVDVTVQPLLEAHIDGSALRVAGRTHPFQSGLRSEVDVRWQDVDLAHWLEAARPLLPEPWRPLARNGRLDTDLKVVFEQRPAPAQPVLAIQGRLGVRALDLSLPDVPGAGALDAGWQQLEITGLDLQPLLRKAALAKLALDGVNVKLRPVADGTAGLPNTSGASRVAASATAMTARPSASAATASRPNAGDAGTAAPKPAAPWAWSVGQVRIGLSNIDVQTFAAPWPRLTQGLIEVQGLDGGERAQPAKWTLSLSDEHEGKVAAQGQVQVAQLAAEAELQIDKWSLPPWLTPVQQSGLLPVTVKQGQLSLHTRVRLNALPTATGQPPLLRVEGTKVGVEGAQVLLAPSPLAKVGTASPVASTKTGTQAKPLSAQAANPDADQANWQSLTLDGIEADVSLAEGATGLQRLKVAAVTLDALDAAVSRDAQGRVLAGLSEQPAARPGAAPVSTASAASTRSSSPPGAAQPAIAIDLVQCRGCAVRFTDRSVQPAARIALQQTDLSVQGVSQRLDQAMKIDLRTRAQGRGQLGFQGDLRPEPLSLKGQVSVSALDLRALQPYLDPHVNVTLAGAAALAQGRVNVDTVRSRGGDVLNVRYQGRLGLQDLRLRDRVNDAMLLRWASFTLDRTDLAWRDGAIDADLGFIALKDFYGRVIVNRDGTLNLASVVRREGEAAATSVTTPQEAGKPVSAATSAMAAASSASVPQQATPATTVTRSGTTTTTTATTTAAAPAPSASTPPRLRWQGIHLEKGEVDFTDTFIQPNYSAHLTRLAGDISAVSSAQPEPAKVEVNATLDDSAPVRISGQLHPLGPKLFTDIQGVAKGIELTRLTPYSARYAGYPIEKGTLSVNVHYKVDGGKLQADNQVFLDQLTFGERVDSPEATKLPVLLAVSLLKNARGEIDVNLPISGSLDDPQFSVGGIIWRVIVNLLSKAVLAPFSLLAGDSGGELGNVPFQPGLAELDDIARARLDKLAEKLKDRPSLKLEATGWADADLDREGLRQAHVQQLMRRAKAKAKGVDVDEVVIEPAERGTWLKAAYQAADIKKPRNLIGMAQSLPDEQMTALLKASAVVDAAALKALADDRANEVKAYLSDRLDPERVRLTASRVGTEGKVDEKSGGSSVQFQLR